MQTARLLGSAFGFAASLMFLTSGLAFAQWDSKIQLGSGGFSDIAVSGSTVHAVYGNWNSTILYRRSTDDGAIWSSPVTLDSGPANVHLTDMLKASGSDVWALYLKDMTQFTDWCCPRNAGNIYMRRSRDGGLTWEPPVRLTTSQKAFRISMAVSGNRLDMVWMDYRRGIWDTYYRRSLDRGGTWEPEVVLALGQAPAEGDAERPQVAALGDSVHVTWLSKEAGQSAFDTTQGRFDSHYKRSTDGGATWEPPVRMSAGNGHSLRPDIAALAPGTVVLTWDDDMSGVVQEYARRSTDNGVNWGPPVQLSFSVGGTPGHVCVAAAGSMLHVAWSSAGMPYRLSPDGGASWLPEELISPGESKVPLFAASSNYLHVIWGGGWYRRRTLNAAPVAPAIATQPASQTVTAGQTATFSVTATGTAPLSHQWRKNSANIAGATSASYTTPATTLADSGSVFSVVVSNAAGSVTSTNATLTVAPPPGNGNGLSAAYYDNMDFTGASVLRVDSRIDFNWGGGSPDPAIGADTFSARWTGQLLPVFTETYTFHANVNNGVRLWVRGQLIVDTWASGAPGEYSGTIALTAGVKANLKMEFYESTFAAEAHLSWSSPSTPKQIVPQSQLFSSGGAGRDFNGDRKADVLFRHPSGGGVSLWLMQ